MKEVITGDIEGLFYEASKEWLGGRDNSYTSSRRSGIYSSALTIWLMIHQRLNGRSLRGATIENLNRAIQGIFAGLNAKSTSLTFRRVSTNSGGFSRARDRFLSFAIFPYRCFASG